MHIAGLLGGLVPDGAADGGTLAHHLLPGAEIYELQSCQKMFQSRIQLVDTTLDNDCNS